ncbi:PIN domain-containing protein [Rhodoplanes sp. SY1]|uniref:PIN domain-containing protein n=1 Tax=Rhodoplanes sp. SY1 TaxID=3166646 RepID=UPI0038B4B054
MAAGYPDWLFARYRSKGILVDTNLMVLVVVGTYAIQRISTFKRTRQYTIDDYALMMRILAFFERRVTTPNILTEVDNLTRQLPEDEHDAISETMVQLVSTMFEVYQPATPIMRTDLYPDLGLTDCATVALSQDFLVLTDDYRLSNVLTSAGRDAVNINYIRSLSDILRSP